MHTVLSVYTIERTRLYTMPLFLQLGTFIFSTFVYTYYLVLELVYEMDIPFICQNRRNICNTSFKSILSRKR